MHLGTGPKSRTKKSKKENPVGNRFAHYILDVLIIGGSFSRLVPFEPLSCLSDRGWHDVWSKTYVVTTEERDELKKLLLEQNGVFISDRLDLLD